MTVEISWFLKGRVLYTPGTTVREEMSERNGLILELIESEGKSPLVHTLIDHTNRYNADELVRQPKRLNYYAELGYEEVRQRLHTHPMFGWVISVATPNVALKLAGTVASQQRNYRWHSTATLEEALDFLQERDVTLPDLHELKANIN